MVKSFQGHSKKTNRRSVLLKTLDNEKYWKMITTFWELALTLGLLLVAHCDIRARDPEMGDKTHSDAFEGLPLDLDQDRISTGVFASINNHNPRDHKEEHPGDEHIPWKEDKQLSDIGQRQLNRPEISLLDQTQDISDHSETGGPHSFLLRTGNRCGYVERKVTTMAVSCGTEKYTIKSQSPCPSETPNCQIIMYKLSTRPVYRAKRKIHTSLLWRCCPGHGGDNCDNSGSEEYLKMDRKSDWEQNDFQVEPDGQPLESIRSPNENETSGYLHLPPIDKQSQNSKDREGFLDVDKAALPTPHGSGPISVPNLVSLILSQLAPVLDAFNHSLERLSLDVATLSSDMNQLKRVQEDHQRKPVCHGSLKCEGDEDRTSCLDQKSVSNHINRLDGKLEENLRQVEELKAQVETLPFSQHVMMYHNFTALKTYLDAKLNQQQKHLLISLQTMNLSISEKIQGRQGDQKTTWDLAEQMSVLATQGELDSTNTAVRKAIGRLDESVVNNTVKLTALTEGFQIMEDNLRGLVRGTKELEDKIEGTGRKSQIQFMETGLEVDAARTVVLQRVEELASNLTLQKEQFQEMETDVDYLFKQFYANVTSGGRECYCHASISLLQQAITDINIMASENRAAIESSTDRMSSLEDLKEGLSQMQNSLAFEQERTRALGSNMTQLQLSLLGHKQVIQGLKDKDGRKENDMQRLTGSFNSLLKDAIRHTEVLEIVLGMEVLEFLAMPKKHQMESSMPAIKSEILQLKRASDYVALDKPSDQSRLTSEDIHMRHDKKWEDSLYFEQDNDGQNYNESHLRSLKNAVEEIAIEVMRFEEQSNSSYSKSVAMNGIEGNLQAIVNSLWNRLNNYLKVFDNISSLRSTSSPHPPKPSETKPRKVEQQDKQQKRGSQKGILSFHHRSKDTSSEKAIQSDRPLAFLSSTESATSKRGPLVFEDLLLDWGQMYSTTTGIFRAPVKGLYLFIINLNFGSKMSLVKLIREGGITVASLHQSEWIPIRPTACITYLLLEEGAQVFLELTQGRLDGYNSYDNTFAGLLLYQMS